jgi:hypothetical protein
MNDWKIGLSAWIIQDGNYGEFRCHQRAEFEIEQTDAWKDDSGHGEYVVECTLMDVPPKRERR